ncbi:MAG: ATP-binding protein [Myxococcales bacterium]|nr:ATP-binding protein [Myxococcales bacterium]
MFRTSVPVTEEGFTDREPELERLRGHVRKLVAGAPSWVAILGPRKIGKTSLILELARRTVDPKVVFVVLDNFEELPLSCAIFRRYALRVLDGVFAAELGTSLEALAHRPGEFRAALQESSRFARLPPQLRARILELPERPPGDGDLLRDCLDLPERLAQALGLHIVVAWDEFQELANLSPGRGARGGKASDPLPLARSIWQKHKCVGYFVSGSARTMLRDLVTAEHSPFFQHFALMEIGPFPREEGIGMLLRASADDRPIPRELAARAVDILGGYPFYLQLLGETLMGQAPPLDEAALKEGLQDLLFSRTGRLALYFQNEYQRLVGRSTYLAAALQALSDGSRRLADVAAAIGAPAGATVRYLERLDDAIARDPDGRYRLDDPTFGLWLAWRRPGGTVVPMRLVGDEAEQAVAEQLARMGFDLVYQSRASRGAFDLLATRGNRQLGLQVKRANLPLRFDRPSWARMEAESARFGWRWVVAAVGTDGEVALLDPRKAKKGRGINLDRKAAIPNLLAWLERPARK